MLVKALHNGGGLSAEVQKACVCKEGNVACKARPAEEDSFLNGLKVGSGWKMAKRLEQMSDTGAWLSAIPNRFDGT